MIFGECVVRNMEEHLKWSNIFRWIFNIRIIHGNFICTVSRFYRIGSFLTWFVTHVVPAWWCIRTQICATMYNIGAEIDTWIIGYGRQQVWPPRSSDLSPLNFFLWGFLKSKLFECESTNKSDLLNRISMACQLGHQLCCRS